MLLPDGWIKSVFIASLFTTREHLYDHCVVIFWCVSRAHWNLSIASYTELNTM